MMRCSIGEALVFHAELSVLSAVDIARLRRGLTLAERLRAETLVRPADRDAFLVAHALLHRSLAWATGRPARLGAGPHGRPELRRHASAPPLSFSLSRTAGLVACALARGATVGLDVEAVVPGPDPTALAARLLAREEAATLAAAPPEARAVLFCRFWTLREAVAKALGTGLARPLPDLVFGLDPPRLTHRGDPGFAAGWQLAEAAPTPRHRAALALQGAPGLACRLRWQAVDPAGLARRGWAPD